MSGEGNKKPGHGMPGPGGPGGGPHGRNFGRPVQKPKNAKASVKRLMGYLRKDKLKFVIVFFCVALSSLSNLAGTYILRPIINGLGESFTDYSNAVGEAAKSAVVSDAVSGLIRNLFLMA